MKRVLILGSIFILLALAVVLRITLAGREQPAPGIEEVQAREGIPVDVATVRTGVLATLRSVSGEVRGSRQSTLSAPIDTRIETWLVREGERVRRGQPLVRFDVRTNPDQGTRYRQAQEALANAERNAERLEALSKQGAVAESDLDNATTALAIARANLEDARRMVELTSPIDGTVTWVVATPGASIPAGTSVVQVANLDSVLVVAEVAAPAARELKLGASVRLNAPAAANEASWPESGNDGAAGEGRIVSVSIGADPISRLYEAKALLDNRRLGLRPGQFVTLSAVTGQTDSTVVAPRSALLTESDIEPGITVDVYAIDGETASRRKVTLGAVAENEVEIRDGLRPGDRVVVFGANRLQDGAKVKLHKVDDRMVEATS